MPAHGDINGLNLYAYCANNPIMFCDPTGQLFGFIKKAVKAVVGTVVDVVNIVSNAVNDTIDAVGDWVNDNMELILTVVVIAAVIAVTIATAGVGGVAAGILIGAALGAASSAALDVISQGFANGFDNINWGSVGKAAVVGGILGGIGGGIGGKMAAMAGKTVVSAGSKTAARTASSAGSKAGNVGKETNVIVRMVRDSELTKEAQAIRAGLPKNAQGHTVSNMKDGQQIHKGFMVGAPGKEKTIPSLGRADVLSGNVIFELKPNNPRAIANGIRQLQKYNKDGNLKMILVLY